MADREKILIAVDGSEYSLFAVGYAVSILDPQRFHVVLLNVLTKVPESFIDLEKIPAYRYRLFNVDAWEQQQEKVINDFMKKACEMLSAAGFPADAVTVRIDERKVGIARDVASESLEGYKAIIVGRKGMSELKDFMLGSIAHKILELAHIPVWIVGSAETPKRILLCMDNSEGAMIAVKHLGSILDGREGREVVLFHAMRGLSGFKKMIRDVFIHEEGEKQAMDQVAKELKTAETVLEPSFDKAKVELVKAGVSPDKISCKIGQGGGNSGNAIIEEAEKHHFDTIVVGRRGISRVEEFLMGRVSNKVIHLAREKTVWVVS